LFLERDELFIPIDMECMA